MAIFDATVPANSEGVKLGAQRIREVKTSLNTSLAVLLNDDNTVKNASIPLVALAATIGAAQITDDSITPAKVKQQAFHYATGVYSAGNYTVTLAPVAASLVVGMVVRFIADTANTGAATLTVNGTAAGAIKKFVTTALEAGDIAISQAVEVVWDGTNFQMISPWASLIPVIRDTEAKAWVKFDSLRNASQAANTWTGSGTVATLSGTGLSLTDGQAVAFYSTGTLPGSLVAGTLYYVKRNGADTSYHVYASSANALADTSQLSLAGGSGTHYFLAVSIKASYNVSAVIPVLNASIDGTPSSVAAFTSYDVYFTAALSKTNYATTVSAKPPATHLIAYGGVDNTDPGSASSKRITVRSMDSAGSHLARGCPEVNAVIFEVA